jgi:hypothetical protein
MLKIKTKINTICFEKDKLILECNKYNINIPIIDGSYDIIIKNTDNDFLGVKDLDKNDIINIKYLKKDKKYIYPTKIIVNTKYNIIDELSDIEK